MAQPLVCGDTLRNNRHLTCRTRKKVKFTVSGVDRFEGIGRFRATVTVRFGRFYYVVKGLQGRKIRGLSFIASTSTSLTDNEVVDNIVTFNTLQKVTGRFRRQIANLPLTPPRTSCCGKGGVQIYIAVRLCNRFGFKCGDSVHRISMKMKCSQICGPFEDASKAVPMCSTQRCPRCI